MKLLNKKVLGILIIFLILLGAYTSWSPRYGFEYPGVSRIIEASIDWFRNFRAKIMLTSPSKMKALPLDLKRQFKGHYGPFLVSPESGVTVYSGPDAKTKKVLTLPGLTRVRSLFLTPDYDVPELHWMFVGDEETGHPFGWVSEKQLVTPSQFNVVSEWTLNYFGFCKGEYCGEVTVTATGFYSNKWYAKGQGLFLRGHHEGKLFEYNGIIWAKKAKADGWIDLFHLPTDGGELRHEVKYTDEVVRIFDHQPRLKNTRKRKDI